jgi:hypothetical protein
MTYAVQFAPLKILFPGPYIMPWAQNHLVERTTKCGDGTYGGAGVATS